MKKKKMTTMKKKPGPAEDMKKVIAELRVRQKSLEKENKALRDQQTKLKASLSAYSNLCENAPVGYVALDREGRILQANRTAAKILGPGKASPVQKRFHGFVLRDDQDIFATHLRKVFRTGKEVLSDLRMGNKKGAFWHALVRSVVVKDWRAHRNVAITTVSDITSFKQIERALQASENKYRSLVDNALVGMFQSNVRGDILFANDTTARMFECKSPDQIKSFKAFSFYKDPRKRNAVLKELKQRGRLHAREFELKTRKGKTRYVLSSVTLTGDILTGVMVDITEQKLAEEALKATELEYARFVDSTFIGVIRTNIKGKILFANRALARMFGFSSPEALMSVNILSFYENKKIREKMLEALKREGKLRAYEVPIKTKSGKIRHILFNATLQDDFITGLGFDITDLKEAQQALAESEEKYRNLIDHSLQGVLIIQDSRIVYSNPAQARILGYTTAELQALLPKKLKSLIHPEDQALVWGNVQKRIAGEKIPPHYEFRALRKDGTSCWLELFSTRIVYEGKPAIQTTTIDITDRKTAEEALRKSEARFRTAFENLPFDFFVINEHGEYTIQNAACKRHWGNLIGKRTQDVAADKDTLALWEENNRRAFAGEIVKGEVQLSRRGKKRLYHNIISPIFDKKDVRGILGVNIDITERKLAEKTVDERLQFEKLVSGISTQFINLPASQVDQVVEDGLGRIGRFFSVEQVSFYRYFAEEKKFLISHRWRSVEENSGTDWLAEEKNLVMPNLTAWLQKHDSFTFESPEQIPGRWKEERQFIKTIGSKAAVLVRLNVGGEFMGVIVIDALKAKRAWPEIAVRNLKIMGEVFANAISRKEIAEALGESEEKFRAIFENAKDGFLLMDLQTKKFQSGNQMIRRMLNASLEKIKKMSIKDILLKKDSAGVLEQLENQLQGGAALDKDLQVGPKRGRTFYASLSAFPITLAGSVYMVLVIRDITEKKIIEEELLKTDKLESLGKLAGGLAHDFNNILTGVLGNITMARIFVKPEERAFKHLERAEKASWKGKNLTQQLLTFAKGGEPVKKVISMGDLIMESAGFASTGSNITCRFDIPEDLWPVEADEGQMNQVINNLVINADQAMPAGGEVLFHAENITFPGPSRVSMKAGSYVKIVVKDQGIGIPKKYHSRVFDPYFTTKQKGSGLGLTTAYSILRNHDGLITLASRQGKGTTITIYLPASREKVPLQEDREGEAIPGEGRILVLDDDPAVSEVVQSMLRNLGYKVELSANSKDAIARFRNAKKTGRPFAAVILDLTMPGDRGGKAVIRDLLKIDPDVRGIVTSGYSDNPVLAKYREYGFRSALAKPFKTGHLGKALQQAIKGTGK